MKWTLRSQRRFCVQNDVLAGYPQHLSVPQQEVDVFAVSFPCPRRSRSSYMLRVALALVGSTQSSDGGNCLLCWASQGESGTGVAADVVSVKSDDPT